MASFEIEPGRPAPSPRHERTARVRDALRRVFPKISRVKIPNETEQDSVRDTYFPETLALIDSLLEDPTRILKCSHGEDDFAIGVYEVPTGCVALPGLETQLLCPHHAASNGSFEGMYLIVDLSVGAEWSKRRGEEPDYCMIIGPESDKVTMVEFANSPFVGQI